MTVSKRTPEVKKAYIEGWNDAIASAARVAEEWDHYGDPAKAMCASPQIRDRIKKLAGIYEPIR
jgi:hypothetical protein